jgi:hypothetical protein
MTPPTPGASGATRCAGCDVRDPPGTPDADGGRPGPEGRPPSAGVDGCRRPRHGLAPVRGRPAAHRLLAAGRLLRSTPGPAAAGHPPAAAPGQVGAGQRPGGRVPARTCRPVGRTASPASRAALRWPPPWRVRALRSGRSRRGVEAGTGGAATSGGRRGSTVGGDSQERLRGRSGGAETTGLRPPEGATAGAGRRSGGRRPRRVPWAGQLLGGCPRAGGGRGSPRLRAGAEVRAAAGGRPPCAVLGAGAGRGAGTCRASGATTGTRGRAAGRGTRAGGSAAAGEGAAGWTVGVFGSSVSTTGPSGRGAGAAGRPQARCAPSGPAPQSASRRTRPRTRARRPRRGTGAGAGAVQTGAGAGAGGSGRGRAAGTGTGRTAAGRRAAPVRCTGRDPLRADPDSARSRTSRRPPRVRPSAERDGRGATARSFAMTSSSDRCRGRCGQGER